LNHLPIGLMGGTFDPPHYAHLRLAEEAREALGLDSVRWIPSGQPGHRGAPATSPAHRLEMVRLAIAGHPHFTLDDAEVGSGAPTFTIDTLTRLRAELGADVPLVMIIGMDSLLTLPTWRESARLFGLTHFAAGARPGYAAGGVAPDIAARFAPAEALRAGPAGAVAQFRTTPLDISASSIRATIAAGRSARYLLPREVLHYIGLHGLYRAPST
jgi:nicotinate-nucleotide adenylyltransferase